MGNPRTIGTVGYVIQSPDAFFRDHRSGFGSRRGSRNGRRRYLPDLTRTEDVPAAKKDRLRRAGPFCWHIEEELVNSDNDILRILERDARLAPARIAAMTGRSEQDVRAVIAGFESAGTIRSYRARIDWEKAGEPRVFAFIDVDAQPERGTGYDRIAERIYRYPEVHSVYLVSGAQDLRVVVEGKTMQEVANFVAEKLATIDGVRGTATHFLLKKYKDDGDLFTDPEPDERLAVAP
jgi:DNA-binding Lrp family transcriptional regulator